MLKNLMFGWLAQPYIFYAIHGIQKANALFAIFDNVEAAWYIYGENSLEFARAELNGISGTESHGSFFVAKLGSPVWPQPRASEFFDFSFQPRSFGQTLSISRPFFPVRARKKT